MSYAPPPRVRPSGAAYLIPAFIWIATAVIAFVVGFPLLINGVADAVEDLERVPAATGGSVELDEGHNYLYYDNSSTSSSSGTAFAPTIQVTVLDPGGNEVPLEDLNGKSIDYSTDGESGVLVGQFDAPTDGTYQLQVAEGTGTQGGEILVGGNVVAGAKTGAIVFFAVGAGGFLVALIVFIVIARKRGKSKRQMQQGYGSGGWPGGQGGSQGGYGAPSGYPDQGGYGAPASYPAPGGYQPPPSNYPPPSNFPPQGGGFPPSGGGYQPPGGYPPSGS